MLNKDFLQRKIKLIQEDISGLEELSGYTFDEIVKDKIKSDAAERMLEKIITRAIDINQHIVAELARGDEKIRGYEDTFHALSDLGVYDKEFGEKIAPSAGLRNRLVHEYNNTEKEIIYKSVNDAIKQYAEYCNHILKFLEK